jgi:HEPN domain-containing protein
MTKADRAKEWLRFAEYDLRSAEVLLREKIWNEFCFHSQQCAEKTIKAFLVSQGRLVPKTHRLVDLLEEAIKSNSRLSKLREACVILDQYYVPTRYPDAVIGTKSTGLPTQTEAKEALALARKIDGDVRPLVNGT